ncbi:MAG: YraN family protein [Burkholderiaceae bacterium]|nr:YraN family protein [Burkholderiaceae bacterium]
MLKTGTSKETGDRAETLALNFLKRQGLSLVERNYRVARGPTARGGEVDLIVRAADGTLVFVEVRARASSSHGGAAASITATKRRRLVFAAQHYLLRWASPPPCRFDVVAVQGDVIEWLPAAFDAG